jgi:hypothetical protein
MPTAVRSASIPATVSSNKSNSHQSDFDTFTSIALFSGIGLLASLIAFLCGLPWAWL